jgi:hypothetical protein
MDNQDILKKTEKISFADSIKTAHLGIYLWFQVPVGERRRMHEFNSRKYLFRNISSLSSRYLSTTRQHVPLKVSKLEIFHRKKKVEAIFEPTVKLDEYSGVSGLRRGQSRKRLRVQNG